MAHVGSLEVNLLTQMPGVEPVLIGKIQIPIDSDAFSYGPGDFRINQTALRLGLAEAFELEAERLRL